MIFLKLFISKLTMSRHDLRSAVGDIDRKYWRHTVDRREPVEMASVSKTINASPAFNQGSSQCVIS